MSHVREVEDSGPEFRPKSGEVAVVESELSVRHDKQEKLELVKNNLPVNGRDNII